MSDDERKSNTPNKRLERTLPLRLGVSPPDASILAIAFPAQRRRIGD